MPTNMRFCIYCGEAASKVKDDATCPHLYKPPLQMIIPCKRIYGNNPEWVLYTIDNAQKYVFMDSIDFNINTPHQYIGYGGIVLRDAQFYYNNVQLMHTEDIKQFIMKEYELDTKQSSDFIQILYRLNSLIISQTSAWPFEELVFESSDSSCVKLPMNKLPILELVDRFHDQTGKLPLTEMLKPIYLHGQWDAKSK